jgi:DNA-binding LacI/PurR family transcriptional regulator
MQKRQITITDIARQMSVHHSTVSLALRDHPSIPEATRERIKKAAREIGYRPDPAMAALSRLRKVDAKTREVPSIAYVVNNSPEMGFYRMVYPLHFLQGAREQAASLGFDLDLQFLAPGYHDSDTLSDYLEEKGIKGVLISAFLPGCMELTLDWSKYSAVKIDSHQLSPPLPVVTNDQLQMVRLAFRQMVALGYRRIGLTVGLADEVACEYRNSSGYAIEQASTPGTEWIPPLLYPYNTTRESIAPLLASWIRRYRIEAVLGNSTAMLEDLRAQDLKVPEDLAYGCLCLYERFNEMAGVVNNLRLVGARAVAQLAEQMRVGQPGAVNFPAETFIRGYWRDGPTAPPKKGIVRPPVAPLSEEPFLGPIPPTITGTPHSTGSSRNRPRMRDVADRAGVSTTTVSLALRNAPSISDETRSRVRRAADELGYHPDPLLDAFNQHRANIQVGRRKLSVAFIVDACKPWRTNDAYHCDRLRWEGLQEEAALREIQVERLVKEPDLKGSRLNSILLNRGINGIIVAPFTSQTEQLDLDWQNFSAVKIESAHIQPPIDIVMSDPRLAVQVCFKRLRMLGYRRIGMVTWFNDEQRLERSHVAGLQVEQAKIPKHDRIAPFIFTDAQIDHLDELLPQWIREHKIDAVVSNWNNLQAIVQPNGHRKVAFASLDVNPDVRSLAGVVQNHRLVGRRALEHLAVLMRSNQHGVPVRQAITLTPGFWRDGATAPAKLEDM